MTSAPFAHWSGPLAPKIVLVGEAWGETEASVGRAFVGASGQELWRLLGEAWPDVEPGLWAWVHRASRHGAETFVRERERWLAATGIAFTNVLALRPPGNKIEALCGPKASMPADYTLPPVAGMGKYLLPEFLPEVDRLHEELRVASPNLVVAMGNTACWAILGKTNIGSIRGAITMDLGGIKVLPTYHPAAILRQWSWRPITLADLMKARREGEFPEIHRPRREVLVDPLIEEVSRACARIMGQAMMCGTPIAADIETEKGQITKISFAASPEFALVIPFVDRRGEGWSYWPDARTERAAWECVQLVLEASIPKLFQNGVYDLQYLAKMGFRPVNCTEDTMLLHHSLFPEMQKGLGFMGSVYTNEPAWKLMRTAKADTEKRDE